MKMLDAEGTKVEHSSHPVEIFARAYGLMSGDKEGK
jgi:hypothetical protein